MRRTKKKSPTPELHELGLLACLKTNTGRAFLWDLLDDMGCFRISANLTPGNPIAPYSTYFREGARNKGNKLLLRIQQADLDGYLLMQREALQRASQRDDRREDRRAADFGPGHGDEDGNDDDRDETRGQ